MGAAKLKVQQRTFVSSSIAQLPSAVIVSSFSSPLLLALTTNNMDGHTGLRNFLASEEGLADTRLRCVTQLLEQEAGGLPSHILEALNHLRQNAEEDLSNILHIQSTLPSATKPSKLPAASLRVKPSPTKTVKSIFTPDSGPVLGQVDEGVETALAVTDDLFLIEGMEEDLRSPQSLSYSEDEREDSEADEGIHIPCKRRGAGGKKEEVAASLPVGIPLTARIMGIGGEEGDKASKPVQADGGSGTRDIAASMAALARSVHMSSMFGDNVFGELPRPRLNTGSKN